MIRHIGKRQVDGLGIHAVSMAADRRDYYLARY